MPAWLVPTLKWGGIALAIIAAIAIIYVRFIAAPAPPEATPATDEAPMTLYWIMLLVGIVAAIAGFVFGRRPGPT
jgi:Na+/proline symporter